MYYTHTVCLWNCLLTSTFVNKCAHTPLFSWSCAFVSVCVVYWAILYAGIHTISRLSFCCDERSHDSPQNRSVNILYINVASPDSTVFFLFFISFCLFHFIPRSVPFIQIYIYSHFFFHQFFFLLLLLLCLVWLK